MASTSTLKRSLMVLASVTALAAAGCGGGGDGGGGGGAPTPTPTPTPTPPPPPTPSSFSFSGTLTANQFLRVDSDINDVVAPPVDNGGATDIASAQLVSNPAIISGYVTATATGQATDNFETTTDEFDGYRVSLATGQNILLDIADFDSSAPTATDLDLFLTDTDGVIIATSQSFLNSFEAVTVSSSGDFLIFVRAFEGSSNYTLTISSELATAAVYTQIDVDKVAPNLLAVDGEPRTATARNYVNAHADAGSMRDGLMRGAQLSNLDSPRLMTEVMSVLGSDALRKRTLQDIVAETRGAALQSTSPADRLLADRLATIDLAKRLNVLEGADIFQPVQYLEQAQISSDPNPDPFLQWNLFDVDWPNAQTIAPPSSFAKTPVVAVLDSGIQNAHPDIQSSVIDQRDFVTADIDGDGFDANAEQDVDPFDPDPGNCHGFHGTHVSSTATAPQNNTGITGVVPTADLIAIKLSFDLSTGPQGDLCRLIVGDLPNAIRYAAQLPNASGAIPPERADVINMSLGSLSFNAAINAAVQDAINAGVVVVASAGNAGGTPQEEFPNFPAALDGVVAVAATDLQRERAFYSSFYSEVDIAAPGGDSGADLNGDGIGDGVVAGVGVLSGSAFEPGFAQYNGTSMAAPHVAAGIAMMRAINPSLTPQDINNLIAAGDLTVDIGAPGKDNETGFGLMSLSKMAEAAFAADGGGVPEATVLTVSPSRLDYGPALTQITVDVGRLGPGDLSVTNVVGDPGLFLPNGDSWVTFNGPGTSDGLGSYQFFADRTALQAELGDGGFTGTLAFQLSDGSSTTLPVSILIGADSTGAETAPVFVLAQLQNPDTGEFETAEQFTAAQGVAQSTAVVSFDGLEGGEYRLIFGTDMDNDGFICDNGELCGAFPFVESSFDTQFTLDSDVTGAVLTIADQSNANVSTLSGQVRPGVEPTRLLTTKASTDIKRLER